MADDNVDLKQNSRQAQSQSRSQRTNNRAQNKSQANNAPLTTKDADPTSKKRVKFTGTEDDDEEVIMDDGETPAPATGGNTRPMRRSAV